MGNIKYYKHISIIIFVSLLLNSAILLALNIAYVSEFLMQFFGEKKAFVFQLFFWAALGATISCSFFMKRDKEINDLESSKNKSNPEVLRYPDPVDVQLYLQRIFTSGLLGVIGAVIIFAGFSYFDIPSEAITTKHKLFLIIFCFLIGMYQGNFVSYLSEISKRFLKKTDNVSS